MELPSFDLLWQSSKKLLELESVLEEIDQQNVQKKFSSKKRPRRDGLFGVGFAIEDRSYYEPYKYCCDQAFYTEVAYNTHVSQHVKCSVEGCSFISHPKSMRLHKEVVHDSGLFDKIYRDTTDAAILQWREARKRNYPTLERAAVKQEILSERLARGQVFKTQEFGTFNRRRAPVITPRDVLQCPNTSDSSIPDDNSVVVQAAEEPQTSVSPPQNRLPSSESDAFTNGCARLVPLDYDSDENSCVSERSAGTTDISDNESRRPDASMLPTRVPLQKNNLPSDNHEIHSDNDEDQIAPSTESQPQRGRRRRRGGRRRRQRIAKRHTQSNSDGEENEADGKGPEVDGNEALTTDAIEQSRQDSQSLDEQPSSASNPFASHPVVQLRAKRRACLTNPNRIHSRPTLLQMLLAEDMRTERNQLMQCVRYVVKNNFFLDEGPS